MQFVTIQTEITTAVTDAILGLLAITSAVYLYSFKGFNRWKIMLWCWIMLLLAIGSVFGVLVHGFKLTSGVHDILMFPLYLSLALAVALFVDNAIYDCWGLSLSRRMLFILLTIGCIFSIIAQLIAGDFLIFLLYEGLAMLFVLVIYFWLTISKQLKGTFLIICGILLTIFAAIIQTIHSILFAVIWQFNNNALFHFIQMIGIVFLVAGVRKSVLSSNQKILQQSEVG